MEETAKLLIAEDDGEMRTLLRKVLTREGYDVEVAGDGDEAVGMLRAKDSFDLLITDIRMPQKDGLQVLKEVRGLRPDLKVIMITAYAELEQYLEVMKEGAFEYLRKPFKIPDLLEVVERALGGEAKAPTE